MTLVVVVGLVLVLVSEGRLAYRVYRLETAQTPAPPASPPAPVESPAQDPLLSEVIARLLDAALPPRAPEPTDDQTAVRHQAEYEPPIPEIRDWTDPFFGLEREMVGGLRPGEGIPGIGGDANEVETGGEMGTPLPDHAPDHDWSLPDDYEVNGGDAAALELYEQWVEETRRDG